MAVGEQAAELLGDGREAGVGHGRGRVPNGLKGRASLAGVAMASMGKCSPFTGGSRWCCLQADRGLRVMTRWRLAVVFCAAMLMSACQAPAKDPQIEGLAKAVYDAVRHNDQATLDARFAPVLKTPAAQAQFARIRSRICPGEPRAATVIGQEVTTVEGRGKDAIVSVEYDYGDRVALVQTRLAMPQGAKAWQVRNMNVQTATAKALAANDFTLADKTTGQYGFLLYAIAAPLLMLAALIKVAATPGLRWKWLWALVALFGLFQFKLNWTSGLVTANWLSVQLIGAGFWSGTSRFAPWIISATLPVGALLILAGAVAKPSEAAVSPASADSAPWPAP